MWENRFLNKTYSINDQNVNISRIQIQHCIFDHTLQKSYPDADAWSCQQSHMTICKLCRSTVDAQCDGSTLQVNGVMGY